MPEAAIAIADAPRAGVRVPFAGTLLRGTAALATATALERALAFGGSFLAARAGGAGTLGAYTMALSTALNVASYTGAGMGTTATRFAAGHGRETAAYAAVVRALAAVASLSALLAAVLLIAAAEPVARVLLRNEALTPLLRVAGLAAAATILLDGCRGFLVGVRRYGAVLLVAVIVGVTLLVGLPLAARLGPMAMVVVQAGSALAAVAACLALAGPLGLAPLATRSDRVSPVVRTVWQFGLVQLGSLVAVNAAGWWLNMLVARTDPSLVAMGLLAVGLQLRNMVGLAPGLLTQSGYSLLVGGAQKDEAGEDTPAHALRVCTALAMLGVLVLAGGALLVLPWALPWAYGASYHAAVAPTTLLLATAVVHMGGSPAAARLTVVDARRAGLVNLAWAALVVAGATWWVPWGGVVAAAGTYLAAHLLSVVLVLVALGRRHVPSPVGPVTAVGSATALVLALLALARDARPEQVTVWTLALAAVWAAGLALVMRQERALTAGLWRSVRARMRWERFA